MNIKAAIYDVVERLARGKPVRVKLEYKEIVLSQLKEEYPSVEAITEKEDENYTYLRAKTNE